MTENEVRDHVTRCQERWISHFIWKDSMEKRVVTIEKKLYQWTGGAIIVGIIVATLIDKLL